MTPIGFFKPCEATRKFARAGFVFEQVLHNLFGVLRREDLVPELDEVAVETVEGQVIHLEVDVRRTLFETQPKQAMKLLAVHRLPTLRAYG